MVGLFTYFFNSPPTTEIYTLSLHDALPISQLRCVPHQLVRRRVVEVGDVVVLDVLDRVRTTTSPTSTRSEEHTSELQSHSDLVCRLLLEKKKSTKRRRDKYRGSAQQTIQHI